MTLFNKVACFTDIHWGKKSDSELHNKDCYRFIDWFLEQVIAYECDSIIFLGDWYDNKSRLRVDTQWYSVGAMNRLNSLGIPIHWLVGNHDIFFKTNRDVHSLPFLHGHYENISVYNEVTRVGDVLFCPWLVGNEFTTPPDTECKYIFGHFGLPTFLMNENIKCLDKGMGLLADHFYQCEAVFTGHFHKRQMKLNEHNIPVTYIGNCFPHNFNDVGDRDRGCMILEWDKDPEYLTWKDAPNYNKTRMSDLLGAMENDEISKYYNEHSVIECQDDLDLSIEESLELKELLSNQVRAITIIPHAKREMLEEATEVQEEQNVDRMVVDHLRKLDTDGSEYDTDMLVDLYESCENV